MNPSNSTVISKNLQDQERDLIDDVLFEYLLIGFRFVMHPILSVTGISVNVINMAVFFKMGLSDGVTQNFFILSASDFALAICFCYNNMSLISQRIIRTYIGYGESELKAQLMYWSSFLAIPFPQNVSIVATVVIAVVRCCCVAIPLKVKYLLTARRQLAIILTLSGITTITLVYVFAGSYTIYVYNPITNSSIVYNTGIRWSAMNGLNMALFFGSFVIVITCVIILSISLSRASQFRSSLTTGASTKGDKKNPVDGKSKESQRDARIVRTVVLISVVFILCNIPTMVFYAVKLLIKGYAPSGIYKNSNGFLLMVAQACSLLNVIMNIFIYVTYNTRFRTTLLSMIWKNNPKEKRNASHEF